MFHRQHSIFQISPSNKTDLLVESGIVSQFMIDEDREASYAMVMACWRSQDVADSSYESKLKTQVSDTSR